MAVFASHEESSVVNTTPVIPISLVSVSYIFVSFFLCFPFLLPFSVLCLISCLNQHPLVNVVVRVHCETDYVILIYTVI